MSDITHYGYTCNKCPSRGVREWVGDFVGVDHYDTIQMPQGHFKDGSVAFDYSVNTGVRYVPIGFPDRCKSCNTKYQRIKRARECTTRLSYVLDSLRMKYMKFVTLTHKYWSSEWSLSTSDEATARFYSWFITVRQDIIDTFGGQAGPDVLECIEHKHIDPIFGFEFTRYHVHSHGIWLIPYVPFKKWNSFKSKHNIGRSEITSIKDVHNPDTGKTTTALWQATDYLAKYISKENTNVKRMVWGKVRQWRKYTPIHEDFICKKCVKSTLDIHKLTKNLREICIC